MSEKKIIKNLTCWKDVIQTIKLKTSLGFCLSHLEILIVIYLNDGLTRNELSSQVVAMSPSTLKRYVTALANEYEFIIETSDINDTRIKNLHLSGKGHEIIQLVNDKSEECSS